MVASVYARVPAVDPPTADERPPTLRPDGRIPPGRAQASRGGEPYRIARRANTARAGFARPETRISPNELSLSANGAFGWSCNW